MSRGPMHTFRLAHQSKQEQLAARTACVERIKELLAVKPHTAAELAQAVADELQVVRATVFGYLRFMHKIDRSIRMLGEMRGRAELWTLGADPTLPAPDEELDRVFARKCTTVPARQVGMQRHWMDVALFGPARRAA